jgi:DUF438 domain-containing protein
MTKEAIVTLINKELNEASEDEWEDIAEQDESYGSSSSSTPHH